MDALRMSSFDPGQVLMGQGGTSGGSVSPIWTPFKRGGVIASPTSANGSPGQATATAQPSGTLAAEAVRSSGSGPYDQGYRQNLATYAGGQFSRPGGSLTFNPTGSLFGNPTGAGNAPVLGTGTGLLDQALGGQPFSYTPPAPQGPSTPDATNPIQGWQDWINQFRNQGNGFALNMM